MDAVYGSETGRGNRKSPPLSAISIKRNHPFICGSAANDAKAASPFFFVKEQVEKGIIRAGRYDTRRRAYFRFWGIAKRA